MKKIYSVLVENRSGVLCKVAGLFSRRSFNIDSLAVGETDDKEVSCMTIVSSGNQRTLEQIEKQLNKKLDIIKVRTFHEEQSISRELMHLISGDRGYVQILYDDPDLCRAGAHPASDPDAEIDQYRRSSENRYAGTSKMC